MRMRPEVLVLIAALATGLFFRDVLVQSGLAWLLGSLLVLLACRSVAVTFGFWSVPCLFLIICALFHVGLAPFKLLGETPDLFGAPLDWLHTDFADLALLFSSLGIAAFAVGSALANLVRAAPVSEGMSEVPTLATSSNRALRLIAPLLVGAGVLSWLAIVASRLGLGFFLRSYDQYLTSTAGAPLDYVFFTIGLGMMLLGLIQVSGGSERSALAIFGVFSLVALPLGLRGEVLFPAVAYAATRFLSGRRLPSPILVLIASVVLLGLIGGIKEIRQTGLQASATQISSFSPANGLGELGYTLRTVAAVSAWQASGTPPRLGETYIAPVARAVSRAGLADEQPEASFDTRLMNVEIRAREGSIGGSILAEAYRNFAWWGLTVMFILGAIAGFLTRFRGPGGQMLAGVLLLLLLQHVRNSFTPIPLQAALGLFVVGVVLLLSRKPKSEWNGQRDARGQRERQAARARIKARESSSSVMGRTRHRRGKGRGRPSAVSGPNRSP